MGFLDAIGLSKLTEGLRKTREGLFGKVTRILTTSTTIDDALLERELVRVDPGHGCSSQKSRPASRAASASDLTRP